MNKYIISVLGVDSPGVIAAVSRMLFEHDCNIEDVSQTILQNQFAGIFVATGPDELSHGDLLKALQDNTPGFEIHFHVRTMEYDDEQPASSSCEPFVVTTLGPDRKGLVAEITAVFAAHRVNVAQLRAAFRGGDDPADNIMIYEVDIPVDVDRRKFRQALREKGEELHQEISIQHKNIFKAMNRI